MKPKLFLLLAAFSLAGCQSAHYAQVKPDGSRVVFSATSLFSNSFAKGLVVDGTTKTTTSGLRISSTSTEPNAESITASGTALGELIGTAAKSAAKP